MISILKPILPEIILFAGACGILIVDAFNVAERYLMKVAGLMIVGAVLSTIYLVPQGSAYYGLFINNGFTTLIKSTLCIFLLFQLVSSSQFMSKFIQNRFEHLVMTLFMVLGLCVMVSADHLMVVYIGMEIQALAAYTLAAMQRKSTYAAESGVKYFILGSLASVVFLFGVSFIYGAVGSLQFNAILHISAEHYSGAVLGATMILAAFLFKAGFVPFHQWVPDVYQGSPTPSTAVFAAIVKLGVIAVLIRMGVVWIYPVMKPETFKPLIGIVGALSMGIGAFLPIFQTHLKRLLAYSGIGHAGFLTLGFMSLNESSVAVMMAYLIVYGITILMTFGCLMSLKEKMDTKGDLDDLSLEQLAGLGQIRPKHAFTLAICFLSMAGIPPLVGFFPKVLLIQNALAANAFSMVGVAIITTVVGAFYYLKLIKIMYLDTPERKSLTPSTKLNKRLLFVFFPAIVFQLLGCYVPVLQVVYQRVIIRSVHSIFMESNETHPVPYSGKHTN